MARALLSLRIAVLLLLAAGQAGCVQRRLTIRSDPPGALVYVDNIQIGTTPCSTPFLYYGTRQIRLVKDGYETLTVNHTFWPPPYEWPGLDFVSENLVPFELRDKRDLNFKLSPQQLVPTDQLLERAENLRRGSRVELVTPAATGPALPPLPSQSPQPTGIGGIGQGALPPP